MQQNNFQINKKFKDIYNKQNIAVSDGRSKSAINKVENIIFLTSEIKPSKIIEIGAGDGAILNRLCEKNFGEIYYATEITDNAVRTINNRKIEKLKEAVIFDGYTTKYDNNEFDLVILSHVLEHVEYPRKLIYEASRIGKRIFIEVPLEDNKKLNEIFNLTDVGHINYYNYKTIQLLIQSCGLKIEQKALTYPNRRTKKNLIKKIKFRIIKYLPLISLRYATNNFTYNFSLLASKKVEE